VKHYVMRTHSHTDRQQLWKVMTRPMSSKQDAENHKEFLEETEGTKHHNFFIVSRED
jgi:hypothetical protein